MIVKYAFQILLEIDKLNTYTANKISRFWNNFQYYQFLFIFYCHIHFETYLGHDVYTTRQIISHLFVFCFYYFNYFLLSWPCVCSIMQSKWLLLQFRKGKKYESKKWQHSPSLLCIKAQKLLYDENVFNLLFSVFFLSKRVAAMYPYLLPHIFNLM